MSNIYSPIYKKIYNDILQNITQKKYLSLNKLPSENSLSKEYSVNRHTVRHALELLRDDGYIYTQQGKGNFVTKINIPYTITDKSSYSSKIADLGYKPKTKILHIDIIEANRNISENLKVPIGFKVIELKLLRYADDMPLQISHSYFDAFMYRDIVENLDIEPFSLYKVLSSCYPDLDISKTSTLFESQQCSKEQSLLLQIPQKSSLLSVETVSKDQNGNLVEYGVSHFRGDICKIKIDLIGDR
ncbi:MAG: GntR family transcriptional regulator [Sulfurimonas sp.]|nr:GntR family transcriptional regulator [Sulfurimonas sp.]